MCDRKKKRGTEKRRGCYTRVKCVLTRLLPVRVVQATERPHISDSVTPPRLSGVQPGFLKNCAVSTITNVGNFSTGEKLSTFATLKVLRYFESYVERARPTGKIFKRDSSCFQLVSGTYGTV